MSFLRGGEPGPRWTTESRDSRSTRFPVAGKLRTSSRLTGSAGTAGTVAPDILSGLCLYVHRRSRRGGGLSELQCRRAGRGWT